MVSAADLTHLAQEIQNLVQTLSKATEGTGLGAAVDAREHTSFWKKQLEKQARQSEKSVTAISQAHKEYVERATKDARTTAETLRSVHKQSASATKSAAESTFHHMDMMIQSGSTLFREARGQLATTAQVDKAVEMYKNALGKVDSAMASNIQTMGDVNAAFEQLETKQMMAAKAAELLARGYVETDKRFQQVLEAYGKRIRASTQTITAFQTNTQKATSETERLSVAMNETSADLAGAGSRISDWIPSLATGGYYLKQFVDELVTSVQASARFGGQLENLIGSSFWGMTSEELSELQGQYRQTTMAFQQGAGAIDSWEQRINDNRWAMAAFTGGLKESIQMNAHLVDMQRMLGNVSGNTARFLSDQQAMFKNWNRVFGMTAEQFQQLNEQLIQSQSIRTQLYKMDQQRRDAYFKDLQLTYQRLRSQGMLHEQAMQTVEALSELGGQDAKTRIEEAARLQAVMGAVGMGGPGAEAAQMLRQGLRRPEQQQRFADIMGRASEQVSRRMAGGLASELVTGQMIEQAGLEKYLGPQSTFANVELQQGKALIKNVSATQDLTSELTKLRKDLGIYSTAIGRLAGFGQMTGALFSGATGAILQGVGTAGGLALFNRMGGIAGAKGMLSGAGRAGGGVLGSIGGLGRGVGGALLKSLPLIGTALGGIQAYRQFQQGNIGAGLLSTGGAALSLVPGLGTAARLTAGIGGAAGGQLLGMIEGGEPEARRRQENATSMLERNNQLLEKIEQNTRSSNKTTEKIADNTNKTSRQLEAESEREQQQRAIELARERRKTARAALTNPALAQ